MVKLTEEMIVARTRVSDMANVKKLNCWGAELSDISILRKLINVEVLSLSVNCISSLADIQNCRNLQELYIRKNKIPDLSEICWLKELGKLKSLWLEENPCVSDHGELYRVTVIRTLPQLQKLDNVAIQADEMGDAMRRGMELVHPMDRGPVDPYQQQDQCHHHPAAERRISRGGSEDAAAAPVSASALRRTPPAESQSNSHHHNHQHHHNYPPSRRVSNQAFEMTRRASETSAGSPSRASPARSTTMTSYGSRRSSHSASGAGVNYAPVEDYGGGPEYHTGRRYSQQQMDMGPVRRSPPQMEESMRRMSVHDYEGPPTPQHRHSMSSGNGPGPDYGGYQQQQHQPPPMQQQSGAYYEYSHHQQQQHHENESEDVELEDSVNDNHSNNTNNHSSENNVTNGSNNSISSNTEEDRALLAQHYEHTYDQVNQQIESAQQLLASQQSSSVPSMPRRPKNRNSNILSAVLCLIKELDGPSLEVVEMAVRCRMEELDD